MRLSFLRNQAASQETLNRQFITAINSNKPIEKILHTLDNGANIDTKLSRDWLNLDKRYLTVYDGMPAILLSLFTNNHDLFQKLLEKKADVNASNDDGLTPLIYAVKNNMIFTVKNLIDHGADKNQKDKNDQSAIYHAEMVAQKTSDIRMKVLLETYTPQPIKKPAPTPLNSLETMGYF